MVIGIVSYRGGLMGDFCKWPLLPSTPLPDLNGKGKPTWVVSVETVKGGSSCAAEGPESAKVEAKWEGEVEGGSGGCD